MNTLYQIWSLLPEFLLFAVQIIVLTGAFYIILRIFRHTQGIYTLFGVVFFWAVVNLLNSWKSVPIFSYFADGLIKILPLALLILFQDEIRRFLAHPMVWVRRFARHFRLLRREHVIRSEVVNHSVDELVKAVCCLTTDERWRAFLRDYYQIDVERERLDRTNTGALFAIEGITGLEEIRGTGELLDCEINCRLIRTIFFPKTALHDGGVVMRLTRSGLHITAAGCCFPLAKKLDDGPTHSRTNAARGMAEHTDAFVLVISEESGGVLRPEEEEPHRMHRFESPMELRDALIEFCRRNGHVGAEESAIKTPSLVPSGEGSSKDDTAAASVAKKTSVAKVEEGREN